LEAARLGLGILARERHEPEQLVAVRRRRGGRHVRASAEAPVREPDDLARLAELLVRLDPPAGLEEALGERVGPAAVRAPLLRRLGGEAGDRARVGRHYASLSAAAARSGVTTLRLSPAPSSRPAG